LVERVRLALGLAPEAIVRSQWVDNGASGCRVLVTLLHEMIKRDAKKGLATLCIGGGQGVALALERS
jgi:hypothetical protein